MYIVLTVSQNVFLHKLHTIRLTVFHPKISFNSSPFNTDVSNIQLQIKFIQSHFVNTFLLQIHTPMKCPINVF